MPFKRVELCRKNDIGRKLKTVYKVGSINPCDSIIISGPTEHVICRLFFSFMIPIGKANMIFFFAKIDLVLFTRLINFTSVLTQIASGKIVSRFLKVDEQQHN